eukprot:5339376-Pyramimonas_sp.AAC.1
MSCICLKFCSSTVGLGAAHRTQPPQAVRGGLGRPEVGSRPPRATPGGGLQGPAQTTCRGCRRAAPQALPLLRV